MQDAKAWFIEHYQSPICEPSAGLFPDPRYGCEALGVNAPPEVQASTQWYWDKLADFGGAWSLRYQTEQGAVFVVFCGTDGDEGAVELFDATGRPLASAFLSGDGMHWEPRDAIRNRFVELYLLDE